LKKILFCHRTIPLEFRHGPRQKEEAEKPFKNSTKVSNEGKNKIEKNLVTLSKFARSREQGFEAHPTCQYLFEEIDRKLLRKGHRKHENSGQHS